MRILKLCRFSSLVILAAGFVAAGCHRAQTSVASGGTSAASTPVGPVPGGIQAVHYHTNPMAGDAVALQDGRRLFNWYNCSGCHGGHAGGGMGPSLRDETWIYGNRDDQIYDSIAQGRANGMPAWGSKIPETQIWELVSYIKSMRTPQEPEPPVEPADEKVWSQSDLQNSVIGTKTTEAARGEGEKKP